MLYFYIILVILFDALAMSALKEYHISSNILFFLGGIAAFAAVSFFIVRAFTFEEMSTVNVLWAASSALIVAAIGVFVFGDTVSIGEMAGMLLVVSGIVVLHVYSV